MTNRNETPKISIILPVHNGENDLERAIRSAIGQTFADWELLAIDDCSTDGTAEILRKLAEVDSRIRPYRASANAGAGAAWNLGLHHARGEMICYLDHDDEYFDDYLDAVHRCREAGDVLVFQYDFVHNDAPSDAPVQTWQPESIKDLIYVCCISTPLGVSHRRDLIDRIGAFNELLWCDEDCDLWRRFAREGAKFIYVPHKSGRYHIRSQSQSRTARLTDNQRNTLEANRLASRPLFGNRPSRVPRREIKKIVFASPHSIIDYSNGAAIATLHALQFLGKQGFECQSFCGSYLDTPDESRLEEQLDLCRIPYESRLAKIGDFKGRMIFSLAEGLPVTSFGAASTLGRWSGEEEIAAFLTAFCMFLDKNRPDAVLTYGGDAVAMAMIEQVKVRDIPVVFMLHNFLYTHPAPFALVDYATVPSEFCRRHYWDTLKLACHRLPNVVDWRRIEVAEREPRYVTFVNPHRVKGVFVFARIAEVLSRRRPDIPLLIVEGRGKTSLLEQMGLDLGGLSNLHRLEITPDPRNFYRISKLILMPSLWNESFGLVAAEAMISGIPVLASNRGALPETLGNAGFLFDIPPQYTPETQTVPSEEEIEPWVKTIIRLWDDALFYEQASQAARAEAKRWHPDHIAPIYRDFFANLFHQPAPPIMPKDFILSAD